MSAFQGTLFAYVDLSFQIPKYSYYVNDESIVNISIREIKMNGAEGN